MLTQVSGLTKEQYVILTQPKQSFQRAITIYWPTSQALVRWHPCELNISCTSTTAESRAKIWYQYNAFKPPGSLGCCSKAVVLLLLTFCLLLLPLWESVIVLCIVVRYFMSILVLQSS